MQKTQERGVFPRRFGIRKFSLTCENQCDLQRPVCGQCSRLGIPCTGWDRDRVFVNGTGATAAVARYVPPSDSAQALSCSAYEQQYLSIFWDLFLPGGYKVSSESKHMQYAHGNWTDLARGMYSRDGAVRNALLSVCLAAIGTADDRRDLVDGSLRFYVSALAEMGQGLKNPRRGKSVALIVANRALATYEVTTSFLLESIKLIPADDIRPTTRRQVHGLVPGKGLA